MSRRGETDDERAGQPIITASEIGRYVYCRRAWWLERVLGYEPENRQALERGLQLHEVHGLQVHGLEQRVRLARWLLIAAICCAGLLLMTLAYR